MQRGDVGGGVCALVAKECVECVGLTERPSLDGLERHAPEHREAPRREQQRERRNDADDVKEELRELYRVVGDHVALGFKCCATEGNKEAGQSGWEERVFLRDVLRKKPRLRVAFNMAAQYDYKALMLSSVFSAAPAGNGLHSYRLAESIFLGAIPVIVDEKLVLPFCSVLDWSRFSVRVKRAQVPELPAILRAIPPAKVAAMQARLAEVKERYFLYPFSTALALVRLRAARLRNATAT